MANTEKPIYKQIVDYICYQIISNHWKPFEKIPSIRELSVTMQVNPNTTFRAFEYIESWEIVYQKQGIGYYVSNGAREKILEIYRKDFFEETLPEIFSGMLLYEIDLEEVNKAFIEYKSKLSQ